jgi:hypothetical protein
LLRAAGERLLVIWDGSPIHRRLAVKGLSPENATRGSPRERITDVDKSDLWLMVWGIDSSPLTHGLVGSCRRQGK